LSAISQRYDFDSAPSFEQLFEVLRSVWYLWDFDSITAPMPPGISIVACMYEYHRSMPKALYMAGHPDRVAIAAKLSRDFPEWPSTPYIFTCPYYVVAFAHRGWKTEPPALPDGKRIRFPGAVTAAAGHPIARLESICDGSGI
jgi:hypothetical protein